MFGPWAKPRFDSDTLSSIWVMACRDESPVLTAFSVAYRLRGVSPEKVVELVRSRQELFRLGLTRAQSRNWKARYQQAVAADSEKRPATRRGKAATQAQKYLLPDWLQVFDDQGPAAEQERVRDWLHDKTITSSQQALEHFLDDRFVIDEIAFRSQFRIDRDLEAEPSDLATVNWGLEHIERLRRGRAETRQSIVALTTGIGGVAIGAMVALTAPMITTLYQGRPADTARSTIDHQSRLDGYGALSKAVALPPGPTTRELFGRRWATSPALWPLWAYCSTRAVARSSRISRRWSRVPVRRPSLKARDRCVTPASMRSRTSSG